MGHRIGRLLALALIGSTLLLSACATEPKPASALSFFIQPVSGTAGQELNDIQIGFIDSDRKKVDSGIQADITVRLTGGPAGVMLSGTTTVSTVNALAVFNDLVIDQVGAGYTLVATAELKPCDDQAPECLSDTEFPPKASDGFNMQ